MTNTHPSSVTRTLPEILADTIIGNCDEVDILDAYERIAPELHEDVRNELANLLDICPVHVCDVEICMDNNDTCVACDCGCES